MEGNAEQYYDADHTMVKRVRLSGEERRENCELVEVSGLREEVRSMREESCG